MHYLMHVASWADVPLATVGCLASWSTVSDEKHGLSWSLKHPWTNPQHVLQRDDRSQVEGVDEGSMQEIDVWHEPWCTARTCGQMDMSDSEQVLWLSLMQLYCLKTLKWRVCSQGFQRQATSKPHFAVRLRRSSEWKRRSSLFWCWAFCTADSQSPLCTQRELVTAGNARGSVPWHSNCPWKAAGDDVITVL